MTHTESHRLATGFGRAIGGALLAAMPLFMTMEVWRLASSVDRPSPGAPGTGHGRAGGRAGAQLRHDGQLRLAPRARGCRGRLRGRGARRWGDPGGTTAQGVSGHLTRDGRQVEQTSTTVAYVTPDSMRTVALVFSADPRNGLLTVGPDGYAVA